MLQRLRHWWNRFRAATAPLAFDVQRRRPGAARQVLVFTEHVNATYYLSFHFPLERLHAAGQCNFTVLSQARMQRFTAADLAPALDALVRDLAPEVVVFTRYGEPWGVEMLRYFAARGIPTIYHIDDDLLHLPASLGAEIRQRQGALVEARTRMLAEASLVYASTAFLKATLAARFPHQRFHQGIYAPYMADALEGGPAAPAAGGPVIGYMGSKGHHHDLAMIVPAIAALMEARPTLRFETFGTIAMPEALQRFGARVTAHAVQKDYLGFLSHLAHLNWDVGLAPLEAHDFNRCKAPTKFVEYTACGIPVVASRLDVYADVIDDASGVLVADDGWEEALGALLDAPERRRRLNQAARRLCRERFGLPVLERQLISLFDLVSPPASAPPGPGASLPLADPR